MVYLETLLSYPELKIPFTVHINASNNQLGAVISHVNIQIFFLSNILNKPQHNYTIEEKELLAIVKCLYQFRVIPFGYKINVFSFNKNMIYYTDLIESQNVMRWQLILEEFGHNIEYISEVDKKSSRYAP